MGARLSSTTTTTIPLADAAAAVNLAVPSVGFAITGESLPGRAAYLDVQATTPLDPRVLDAMMPYYVQQFGNPHSRTHEYGWEAETAVETARKQGEPRKEEGCGLSHALL